MKLKISPSGGSARRGRKNNYYNRYNNIYNIFYLWYIYILLYITLLLLCRRPSGRHFSYFHCSLSFGRIEDIVLIDWFINYYLICTSLKGNEWPSKTKKCGVCLADGKGLRTFVSCKKAEA